MESQKSSWHKVNGCVQHIWLTWCLHPDMEGAKVMSFEVFFLMSYICFCFVHSGTLQGYVLQDAGLLDCPLFHVHLFHSDAACDQSSNQQMESINQTHPNNQAINRCINQSSNQAINRCINQSSNQQMEQAINRCINQQM